MGAGGAGLAWSSGTFGTSSVSGAESADGRVEIHLAPQPLGDALRALAKTAHLQILFDAELVAGWAIAPLNGSFVPRAALDQVLRGTPLEAKEQAPGIVVIRRAASGPATVGRSAVRAATAANPAVSLSELMVTAERRRERLQDVPISVSAYDRDLMDVQGMRTFDDVARQTPGVDFGHGTNYNSESSLVSIRGIASTAGASTTGVYIDDTPVQSRHMSYRTFDVYPQLFDLDRVEVLRGPQGTLFGSGSEGGTIRFITPDPDFHRFTQYVRAEAGATQRANPVAEIGLAGGGPLIDDRVALRVSASYRYEGGFVDRIDWHTHRTVDPDSNAAATKTVRLALKWLVADNVSLTPSVYYQWRHVDDTAAWWQSAGGPADPTQGQFALPFRNGNALANPSTDAFVLSALKWDWDFGYARLVSNTSYFERNQSAITDYTEYDRAVFVGSPYPAPGVQAPTFWAEDQRHWTQEFRLESNADARTTWTAGLFYQHAYQNSVENVPRSTSSPPPGSCRRSDIPWIPWRIKTLYECNFPFSATPADVAKAIKVCADRAPAGSWIRGGQWGSSFFVQNKLPSPRKFLDDVSSTHPVYLNDDSGHNAWANSAALEAAAIGKNTPNPIDGQIERGADGEPDGVLLETAARLFDKVIPDWTNDQLVAAARQSMHMANAYGITSIKDAGAPGGSAGLAFSTLDKAGALTLNVAICLPTAYGVRSAPLDYAELERQRDLYRTARVHTEFVKFFLDGVPTEARTAAMLEPYLPDPAHGANYTGSLHIEPQLLAQDVTELDKRGFTIKMHATGDRSIRVALDAIEAARKANGYSGLHHELAHAGYIDPSDIPRFAKLDAIPDFSPIIWYPQPIISSIIAALGPRAQHYWPTRTLLRSGAQVASGSDWPAAVPDENPWTGVQTMVTRQDPRGLTPGYLWKEEAVTLGEALKIYTLNGARALRLEKQTGSIESGKSAEIIVLDRNLFNVPITDVAATQVAMTYFEGRLVYGSPH